jgi:NAD(P)-dependent dehydrogenase (short-subunit alcohol dehydrogenase family)
MNKVANRTALISGASRGVGAATAKLLAARGFHVFLNYRDKAPRAEAVAEEIRAAGGLATPVQADVTDAESVQAMMSAIGSKLELLILNASGGMERGKADDYAMVLNRDAQVGLLDAALPVMAAGSRVVFVTSHQAHFYPESEVVDAYKAVAASKRAGEDALRARIPELSERGISLVVVSGAMIDGTITPKLLERKHPGILAERRAAGKLITVEEFAAVIAEAAVSESRETGETVLAGSTG